VSSPWADAPSVLRAILLRTIVTAAAWWALVEGDLSTAWLGGLVVGLVVASSLVALPPTTEPHFRVLGFVRFVPYFLRESTRGGLDVLRRAVHPRLPIHPGWIETDLRLPEGGPSVMLAAIVSLLPGVLSAELRGTRLRMHVLDDRLDVPRQVDDLQVRLADLLGRRLP
jgi:multicomponent Na+:H+ antiporter subunit E